MNRLGPDGCREQIDGLTKELVETATKKEWTIQPEVEIAVPGEAIGKPVPQTIRTRIMRLAARTASKIPGGNSLINEPLCRAIIEWAIAKARENDS
jgi:hypothetical protein